MESENQKIIEAAKSVTQQQPVPVNNPAVTKLLNQPAKSNIKVTDVDAKALLAIQNFQTTKPKPKHGSKIILICLGLLLVLALIGYLLSGLKSGNTSNSSSSSNGIGLPNQSNNYTGNGTTKQINQDVNSCSNPVNAVTTC